MKSLVPPLIERLQVTSQNQSSNLILCWLNGIPIFSNEVPEEVQQLGLVQGLIWIYRNFIGDDISDTEIIKSINFGLIGGDGDPESTISKSYEELKAQEMKVGDMIANGEDADEARLELIKSYKDFEFIQTISK